MQVVLLSKCFCSLNSKLSGVPCRNGNSMYVKTPTQKCSHTHIKERDLLKAIFTGDLGLGIRPGPPEGAISAELSNLLVEAVGQHYCEGHAFFCLIGGIAKHESLRQRIKVSKLQ